MRLQLTIRTNQGVDADAEICAPDSAAFGAIEAQLVALAPDGLAGFWSGSRRLRPSDRLGGPGLRCGDVVSAGRAGDRDLAAGAVLRLHVVGGPASGMVMALPRGMTVLGRAPDCDIVLRDPEVSRRHACITVTGAGITVRDVGSTNGTIVDGLAVESDGSPLIPGNYVRLGESIVCVAAAVEPAAALLSGTGGTRALNRPPRLAPIGDSSEIVMPDSPITGLAQRVQWLGALIPALAGAGLALAMHNPTFLAFALLSPLMFLATGLSDRIHHRRSGRRASAEHAVRSRDIEAQRAARLAEETRARRHAHPDPAAVLRTVTTPDCRLWERRRHDADLLDARLGLADQPARLRIRRGAGTESAGRLSSVPVVVNLRAGPLGLCGPPGVTLGRARWVISQLCALHSPSDLRLALLLSEERGPSWTWTRWLPHLGGRVAESARDHQTLVATLLALLDERQASRRDLVQGWSGPWTVVLVDGAGALTDLPGLGRYWPKVRPTESLRYASTSTASSCPPRAPRWPG